MKATILKGKAEALSAHDVEERNALTLGTHLAVFAVAESSALVTIADDDVRTKPSQ